LAEPPLSSGVPRVAWDRRELYLLADRAVLDVVGPGAGRVGLEPVRAGGVAAGDVLLQLHRVKDRQIRPPEDRELEPVDLDRLTAGVGELHLHRVVVDLLDLVHAEDACGVERALLLECE
jgi:hypothetical protein